MQPNLISGILKLTTEEKLSVAEAIWNNITEGDKMPPIPQEHLSVVNEREVAYLAGKTTTKEWSEVKKAIRKK
ncbi:MAG: addiction module protein [Bacteroidetes bacterium]|nr:addiction module protein [Bacteroidota bacterium]